MAYIIYTSMWGHDRSTVSIYNVMYVYLVPIVVSVQYSISALTKLTTLYQINIPNYWLVVICYPY